MAKNYILRPRTMERIDQRVERLLDRIGNPEPPLELALVRDALELDRDYFRMDDPSFVGRCRQHAQSRRKAASPPSLPPPRRR